MNNSRRLHSLVWMLAAGAFLFLGARLPFRLGRLPGDIAIEGRRGSFYFPLVTCLLLSAAFTLAAELALSDNVATSCSAWAVLSA